MTTTSVTMMKTKRKHDVKGLRASHVYLFLLLKVSTAHTKTHIQKKIIQSAANLLGKRFVSFQFLESNIHTTQQEHNLEDHRDKSFPRAGFIQFLNEHCKYLLHNPTS